MYLLLPPIALYLSSRPEYKPVSMWLGLVLIAAGLIGAGFASAAWGVVLGQGAGYALGGGECIQGMSTRGRRANSLIDSRNSFTLLSRHCIHVSLHDLR
jgi:hypothetical protein